MAGEGGRCRRRRGVEEQKEEEVDERGKVAEEERDRGDGGRGQEG